MKNKGFVHVLVLILVVLGIGVLGYFSWKGEFIKNTSNQSIKQIPSDNSSNSIETNNKTDIENNPTDNWITYTNTKHHVTLKYPPSWVRTETANPNLRDDNGESVEINLEKDKAIIKFELNMLGLILREEKGAFKGSRYKLDNRNLFLFTKVHNDLISAHVYGLTDSLDQNIGAFKVNDKLYSIVLIYPPIFDSNGKGKQMFEEYDQILSSFKFID